jgi:hypothetical protein
VQSFQALYKLYLIFAGRKTCENTSQHNKAGVADTRSGTASDGLPWRSRFQRGARGRGKPASR